ncbi:hypothetical protein SY88_14330 [Clostridiales bacterium PH28_bin88]|nr:hypothetical protein SY88_14330 [Clostridiales bacterium PH28_bin88]
MSPRDLEQGVAWFADQFYSLPSILDRLLLKSRVGLWWNLPRNAGYRLALLWRDGVNFDSQIADRNSGIIPERSIPSNNADDFRLNRTGEKHSFPQ